MTAVSPSQLIAQLEKQLIQCMLADRFPLKRRLQQLKDALKQSKPVDKSLVDIAHKVQASQQRLQARLVALPKPEYPLELPVSGKKRRDRGSD